MYIHMVHIIKQSVMITSQFEACRETETFVSPVLQRSLSNTEDECTHLKEMSERSQEELRELANKYNAAVNEIKELTDKIKVPAHRLTARTLLN